MTTPLRRHIDARSCVIKADGLAAGKGVVADTPTSQTSRQTDA